MLAALADQIPLAVAVLLALGIAIPQLIERRGSGWKEIAEERQALLSGRDAEINDLKLEKHALELRPDMTAVQQQILDAMKLAGERFEAQMAAMQKHEEQSQQRGEKLLAALDAITVRIEDRA